MHATASRLMDFLEQEGKAAAKSLYRGPLMLAAAGWRRVLRRTCFIGVTGSAGKTTTKDLIHAALAGSHSCAKSADSNNQLYSVARTLIAVGPRTAYCVQELGAAAPGGFDPMLALLRPRVGVVTNLGKDHVDAFRSIAALAAEKGKLIARLPADGIAILNADDAAVAAMGSTTRARVVTFGFGGGADLRGEILESRWPEPLTLALHWKGSSVRLRTAFLGRHQAVGVLAAAATACALGVPLEAAAAALAACRPLLGRMSAHPTARGVTFIRDDWKAPVWSAPAALEFLADARATRKVVVLGTLSDRGNDARPYHRIVALALRAAEHVVLVGEHAQVRAGRLPEASRGRVSAFATAREAAAWLGAFLQPGDLVLLKGSHRADHLARIALSFDRDVRCWRPKCDRLEFCDRCRLLDRADPA